MARPLTITAYGNAQVDTSNPKFGTGSLLLDGTGDYLEVPDFPVIENGTGKGLSVSFWIYPTATASGTIVAQGNTTSSYEWRIGIDSSRYLYVQYNTQVGQMTSNQLALNTWTNVVVSFGDNVANNTVNIHINGVSRYQNFFTGMTRFGSSLYHTLYIGCDWSNGDEFTGYLDSLRITDIDQYNNNLELSIPTGEYQPLIYSGDRTQLLVWFNGDDGDTDFYDIVPTTRQASATFSTSFSVSSSSKINPGGVANLSASFQLQSDRVENPSIVFFGNESYTWDDTDTWDKIYLDDDSWRVWEIYANQLSLSVDGIVDGPKSNIQSQFALEVDSRVLITGAANLTVATAVTATAERLPQGRATLAMTTAVTAEGAVTITGESQLENTFNMQATGRILKLANIDITPFALLTADAQVDINAQANLSMSMTQTARGGLLINIDDPLPVTWDTIDPDTWEGFVKDVWDPRGFFAFNDIRLTAAGGTIKDAEANLASEFAVTAQGLRRVNAASDLASEFAVTAQGRRFVGGASIFDTPFNFTVSALNLDLATANLTVSFTLTVDVGRIVQGEIIIDDFFNFEVTAEKLKRASAELVTRFDLTASPTLIPNIILDRIESEFGVNVQGSVIVDGRADLQALATQLTVGQRLPGGSSNIDLEFAVTAIGAVIVDGRAELPAFAAMLSEGRISNVRGSATLSMQFGGEFEGDLRLLESDFILRIISETRVYALDTESRTQPILSETRSWSVDDEQRAFKILEETRTLELAN